MANYQFNALTVVNPPRRIAKAMRQTRKKVLLTVAKRWHRVYLPRHFKANAGAVYHYKFRDPKYVKKKLRQKGHNKPLVWRGQMERMVRGFARFSSTSKGARATLYGPKYLYQYRKDYSQPDKAAETTRTTKKELGELHAFYMEAVNKAMKARLATG